MNEALFSSSRDDWETPPEFFAALNEEFRFTLDVCALPETAKCAAYFTPEDDGLSRAWIAPRGARYFVTRRIRGERKTARDRWHGSRKPPRRARGQGAVVVMLIPARTDTLAFHKYIYHKAEIRFVKGRLRFRVNGKPGDAAPFPSMVVIFRGPEAREEENA